MAITVLPLQYADLALKTEKDPGVKLKADGTAEADFFTLTTGFRVGGVLYILDQFRSQLTMPEQLRTLKREHQTWHSWKIGIEDNGYQWALGQGALEMGLPCVPVPSIRDKVSRAQLVTPVFETGRVRFRGVMENGILVPHPHLRMFFKEADDFPFGETDDCVDGVVGLVRLAFDPDIAVQKPEVVITPGFSVVLSMGQTGRRRNRDAFDVFPSAF